MRTTRQFGIILPNEMARDRAAENWLRGHVGPAYDALKADPTRAVSADQVRATLAAEHKRTVAKSR
ncbi:hypothetical protein [Paraherbaspirillum soli]|uniref:Antitoxin VbhA domain-containing protein n=1 Tax=Paraherbaspirillum soli TaxID=631222 RepID=A0ABW0M6C6_9BURK